MINKGTMQGSVSSPYLFNLFVFFFYDKVVYKAALDKCADNATLQEV